MCTEASMKPCTRVVSVGFRVGGVDVGLSIIIFTSLKTDPIFKTGWYWSKYANSLLY